MPASPWLFLLPVLGYLSGSLSFAVLVVRLLKGTDVREAGSKHATTTNTIRQAGFGPGVVVLLLDILKGFLPVYLAVQAGSPDWLTALTGAAAVAGHCWPVFAGFRGGMGLATLGGSVLAVAPLAMPMGLGLLIALTLLLKHGARASVLTGILLAPLYWALGQPNVVIWLAVFAGAVVILRFMADWRREYRELWLDREKPTA